MAYDLGTARGKIVIDYEGTKDVDKADKDMDRVGKKSKEADASVKKFSLSLSSVFSGLKVGALAVAFGSAAVQAANLGVQVLGIVPALTSIGSLAAALPAAFIGMQASLGILKAAFQGVGDAVTAAFDPKGAAKFQEALDQLSPEAQKFAKEVKAAVPALKGFQQQIQEVFFKSAFLTSSFPRAVKALAGLQPVVIGLAADFGELTRKLVNFGLSADSITFLTNALKATRASFSEASAAALPLLAGLQAVGSVGIPLLVKLGEIVGQVGTAFGKWLSQIAANGQLQTWINTAIETLQTLGAIAKNVGSILFSIIKAASDVGGGLLNTLKLITGQFAAFLNSAEGAQIIRDLFAAISAAAKQLSPVIVTLVGALAKALAPALQRIAAVLGPALLDIVQRLAPVFGPLAAAIADLVVALVPLLPPAAELLSLIARLASTAVTGLVAALGPLVQVLSKGLLDAFTQMEPVITELAKTAIPILAEQGLKLAQAFVPLIPSLVQIAEELAKSLIPQLPALTEAMISALPVVVQLTQDFVELWNGGLNRIVAVLPLLVKLFGFLGTSMNGPALTAAKLLGWIIQLGAALQHAVLAVGQFGKTVGGAIGGALQTAWSFVSTVGGKILSWFLDLPGRLLGALQALPGQLANIFGTAMNGLATLIGTAAGVLVGIFTKLPQRIGSALAALRGVVFSLVNTAMSRLKTLVTSGINNAVTFFRNLPSRARSALGALAGTLSSIASTALSRFRSAVSSGFNNALSFVRSIPGKLKSALGATGSLLYNAGANIVKGLYNGIVSQAGRVLDYVRGLASRVSSAFNKALSIFSPSRVFRDSGVNIVKGLIEGLRAKIGEAGRMAVALANAVIAPTVTLPTTTTTAAMAQVAAAPFVQQRTTRDLGEATPSTFGPYNLTLDGKVVAGFVVDTITGNPTVVSKAANEGTRTGNWTGNGRKAA